MTTEGPLIEKQQLKRMKPKIIRHLLNRYESSFFDNERDSMNFERDAENKISVIKQK
jgi:hypothetical protein